MGDAKRIADNLAEIKGRVATAAGRSGRDADSVRLIAVTKYVGLEATRMLVEAGCTDLGESRPQSLAAKTQAFADDKVNWHLIGHLQRNKIRRILPVVHFIHSIDSLKTLQAVDRIAGELKLTPKVLLEVNVSGDATKHGFEIDGIDATIEQCGQFANVRIRGLMTMASLAGGADAAQNNFAQLRMLRDRLESNCPAGVALRQLSMGMSGDFELGIAEGATMVRIGSALFAGTGES